LPGKKYNSVNSIIILNSFMVTRFILNEKIILVKLHFFYSEHPKLYTVMSLL